MKKSFRLGALFLILLSSMALPVGVSSRPVHGAAESSLIALARHQSYGSHSHGRINACHGGQRSSVLTRHYIGGTVTSGKPNRHASASHRQTHVFVSRSRRTGRLASKPGSRKSPKTASLKSPAKPKYAYALDFFMWAAPQYPPERMSLPDSNRARAAFANGFANTYSPQQLVAAGAFDGSEPLRGGIFGRRDTIKYVILHSTETGNPAPADRVIHSWNRGMRHPGAQYVVDRDGKIYQTVDPDYGTVHVDIFRTVAGINNDNSVGIEIVRSGKQQYTGNQLASVARLVFYLQSRYSVADSHVFGHGQIQPSDRTDPVNFDWIAFNQSKATLRALAKASSNSALQTAMSIEPSAAGSEVQMTGGERKDTGTATLTDAEDWHATNSEGPWTLRFCQALFS